jgi:hypothetical protein
MENIIIVIGYALVGWGLCGATIGIGRNLTSMENALIFHAIAAPAFFIIISMFYFKKVNQFSPLFLATFFLGFVVLMDIVIVATLIEKDYSMFKSIIGTWIPFLAIFLSTYITGKMTTKRRPTRRYP